MLRRRFLTSSAVASVAISRLSVAHATPMNNLKSVGSTGAAATVHPLATRAAIDCMKSGGNAIDAAVAASLMLSVVDPHNSGLGGGGLALIRLASGRLLALDGREMAPSASLPAQYLDGDGKPNPNLSQEGPLAVAVPGLVALLEFMSKEHGAVSWQSSLLQAAQVARQGFRVSSYLSKVLQDNANKLSKYPSSAAILLDSAGQAWKEGSTLQQSDLARTLESLAEQGADWFYRGEFAERLDRFMREQGGHMRSSDLANYKVISRSPISTDYRNTRVIGFPPPSSGGIHISQMLGMLELYNLRELFEHQPATAYHLLLEVMKRAMADRAHWLGDADFAKVPRGLLSGEYLRSRAASIDLERATNVASHGVPPQADIDLFGPGGHTTHLTTADKFGNVVALTQTINTSFGSKLVLPGTGVVLNNEMDDFSLAPGVRNAFGLLGSEANAILARKRPLSSMSPSIVLDSNNQPIFTCGAAGGPRIITVTLQSLIRAIDLGAEPDAILQLPRVHHQWSPNHAIVEDAMPDSIVKKLADMGHQVQRSSHIATAQAIRLEPGGMFAASDPRVPSAAEAW